MALSSQDELILLRKRARRRLVGAVVLVSISTAVLWKVVGHLPEQQMKPESIEIMGAASEPAASAPAAAVKHAASQAAADAAPAAAAATELPANLSSITAPTPPAEKPAPAAVAPAAMAEPKPQPAKPETKPERKPETPKAESKPRQADPAAILEGRFDPDARAAKSEPAHGKSVIQLAALSDPAKVDALRGKLSAIGVTAHFSKVQTSKGEVTRVRVGPFANQAEAQQTLQKLTHAGINGIIINK
ncbi:SPOR domain-containing protein [Chromobacterium amazonense]|uniref:SPOR domain-containing protein n=1 Tax=Chromobacterium amazonense TaxID=1382803 RepID=A0A2S9X5Y0_9NEIS|nr:SPOR domain-containing protein [Chromobacterium amazonense]PRP71086.1 SPOR domain-containing protein [Chromobacterium amazonense]